MCTQRIEEEVMNSKCHRHYADAVAEMWSSIFYLQNI